MAPAHPRRTTVIEKRPKQDGRMVKVTFSVPVAWMDRKVWVVGDFNDWDPTATRLKNRGDVRSASVTLEAGRTYQFRYVDADGRHYDDPNADALVANDQGGTNSLLDLTS
jgi:1,4-alpha-glucan branching enzyme